MLSCSGTGLVDWRLQGQVSVSVGLRAWLAGAGHSFCPFLHPSTWHYFTCKVTLHFFRKMARRRFVKCIPSYAHVRAACPVLGVMTQKCVRSAATMEGLHVDLSRRIGFPDGAWWHARKWWVGHGSPKSEAEAIGPSGCRTNVPSRNPRAVEASGCGANNC